MTRGKLPSFFHHLHPPTIPERQARFRYTLGMGGISVFLSLIVAMTGIFELFYFVPEPDQAALSIQVIAYHVPYGWLVRNIHYWAAQLLVITIILHSIRVVFTGAYRQPRDFNYQLGLLLLIVVLLFDFTGYVLRWDQGIHWALVTGTNLLRTIPLIGSSLYLIVVGGDQPGPTTLVRFYAWHIFGLTIIFSFFTIWHLFRVRRDGGIATPPPHQRRNNSRITRYELARREFLTVIVGSAILLVFANLLPAPIFPPLNDSNITTEIARAPWFFLWIQQLLKYGNPFLLGICAPTVVLLIFATLPYLFPLPLPEELGSWFPKHNRLAQLCVFGLLIIICTLTILAIQPSPP